MCNKCMTLSVLETSLPMQRSHDTLASSIWAKNWCAEHNRYNWLHMTENISFPQIVHAGGGDDKRYWWSSWIDVPQK